VIFHHEQLIPSGGVWHNVNKKVNKMPIMSFILYIASCMAQSFNRGDFPVGRQATVNNEWTSRALQGRPIPASNLAPIITQCNNRNDWAVTYDDGPGQHTGAVLQSLRQRSAVATFFVVGDQIINYPDLLRQAYDEGHEIALHSW
jgi:hypothetical protein